MKLTLNHRSSGNNAAHYYTAASSIVTPASTQSSQSGFENVSFERVLRFSRRDCVEWWLFHDRAL